MTLDPESFSDSDSDHSSTLKKTILQWTLDWDSDSNFQNKNYKQFPLFWITSLKTIQYSERLSLLFCTLDPEPEANISNWNQKPNQNHFFWFTDSETSSTLKNTLCSKHWIQN